jgi:acyl-CoA synthetase (NDP forming)
MSIADILAKAKREKRIYLTEIESKELAKEAGLPVVEARLAVTQKEAMSLARSAGFPVALKIASVDIVHKSDAGGVKLGLTNLTQVAQGYRQIMASVRSKHPYAAIQGVSVQKMARPGAEVIIGINTDKQFGPVVMFGLGGTLVEMLKDVSLRTLPVTTRDISSMIGEIKNIQLLRGYRGQEAADIPSLERIIDRVCKLVLRYPQIKEIDLNPVFAYGDGAIAADARIILEPDDTVPNPKAESYERRRPKIDSIFSPGSVAVVGASVNADPVMGANSFPNLAVMMLKEAGFPAVYPVNRKYSEIQGLTCYPDLASIPGKVDHVIVSIPAEATLSLLDDCARKGVRSVQIFTAGFSESGVAGASALEQQMLRKAREGNFRIIGPNCIGMMAPKHRLISRSVMPLQPGPIAYLTQSGGYADDLPLFSSSRGLRFSKLISYGNALDIDEGEILEYFGRDPDTKIIAAYIEGVKDGRAFVKALREATSCKPVVIQKGGTTESGQRAAYGHTASLAGSIAVFNAVCRQHNAIQVDDLEDLIDTLVALRFSPNAPQGKGVAVVGTGGGPSVIASDEMEKAGLKVPPTSAEVRAKLGQFLVVKGGILTNPIDSRNLISPEVIYSTLSLLGKLPEIHTLVYHMGFHPISQWGDGRFVSPSYLRAVTEAFQNARKESGKPVMIALCPALDLPGMKDYLVVQEAFVNGELPVFHSLRGVARTVARLVDWNQNRQKSA